MEEKKKEWNVSSTPQSEGRVDCGDNSSWQPAEVDISPRGQNMSSYRVTRTNRVLIRPTNRPQMEQNGHRRIMRSTITKWKVSLVICRNIMEDKCIWSVVRVDLAFHFQHCQILNEMSKKSCGAIVLCQPRPCGALQWQHAWMRIPWIGWNPVNIIISFFIVFLIVILFIITQQISTLE